MPYYVRYPRWLYVVRYGELTKIGRTGCLTERMSDYRWRARRDGVEWGLIEAVLPHPEAGQNEQTLVSRFRAPGGPRTEYLDVPANVVLDAMRELPMSHHGQDRWIHGRYEDERARMLKRHQSWPAPVEPVS